MCFALRRLPRLAMLALLIGTAGPLHAADLAATQKLFTSGQYSTCIDTCTAALDAGQSGEAWWTLKIRSQLAIGRYADALQSCQTAVSQYDTSLPLRFLGSRVLQLNDRPDLAEQALATLWNVAQRTPWRFQDAASRVALGQALAQSGVDARQVLELFFDQAKKEAPQSPEPYLASGTLALEKHDYALAAEAFQEAAKRSPDDPDIYLGLAQAYVNDAEQASQALAKALQLNPRHVESLLLQADNVLDREAYGPAEALLKTVLEINPNHPRAWAYRAVLAHLTGDRQHEVEYRNRALAPWKTNPEVDYIIGLKLSQNYRFAEGAAAQQRALAMAPTYPPARAQLCQDLLRLGREEEGWKLADAVFQEDKYNVMAFNLVTLHDHLAKFRTLENPHFLLRMEAREAEIYGTRAMRLLERARETLTQKYGVQLDGPVTVEIFPEQKDFAIRTFGLPGGAGFLGVCFGPVVTVNSPASRGGYPSNWEAVLWHEFCHTITLHKTHNKMPRWLSEGISVYEERQENPAWGQSMTPQYRELILSGGATPVSQLSGAFLKPPTPMHLMFAYYESSMVVEYIANRFGSEAIRRVLTDLGNDVPIHEALARHTEPMEALDAHFAAWLKALAERLAPPVNWQRPSLPPDAGNAALAAWNREHPNSFWGILAEGQTLVRERQWSQAVGPLEKALALYPGYTEGGGAYLPLAAAYRQLNQSRQEQELLERYVALEADAVEPRLRLLEMAAAAKDWQLVQRQAEALLAVNPLIAAPHRYLAQAAMEMKDRRTAIEAYRILLLLDPLDPAEQHYRLAQLLLEERSLPEARREAVKALEEAPRYRAAHALLLQIAAQMGPESGPKPAGGGAVAPASPPTATAPATSREVRP